jgi:hypothetical protein
MSTGECRNTSCTRPLNPVAKSQSPQTLRTRRAQEFDTPSRAQSRSLDRAPTSTPASSIIPLTPPWPALLLPRAAHPLPSPPPHRALSLPPPPPPLPPPCSWASCPHTKAVTLSVDLMITLANRQELTSLPLVHSRERVPLIIIIIIFSHSPPRARTSYTLQDAGNNKMHVQRLASLGSNTRQVRRCPRATLDTIKPESYLSSHPRTSTSCIAVSCMWPSTTCTFWLAYVSTYDVGLVLASSLTHEGRPNLYVACMYNWPLPLHTRASTTSRACDSARLTHSARTREL